MRLSLASLTVLALCAAAPVKAQDQTTPPVYLDDRSSPQSVVESLYNAINRGEFLRAWSYFSTAYQGGDVGALQADYEAFADGYAQTDSVTLMTGPETSEGAAGSTYTTVPVAIEATNDDGSVQVFSGCYTLRLVQPAVQATPPFQPITIEEGELAPAEGSLDAALPAQCPQ